MNALARVTNGAAIDVRNVKKIYGAFRAVDDINLHIEPGEFMTFLGPSGSGKTTTLNLIAGFTDLTEGEIHIGNRAVEHLPAHKRNIGVVFQHYALFPHMTVLKNVTYPLLLRGLRKAEAEKSARKVLEMVKLESFAARYPSELSGGQQQRVAFARAIVFDPPLLLMDEPLGALDKKLREWLQMEIKRIHRELGTTFVYVTHDQEEALILSDRIAVFNRGRIEQIGTGRDLYERPETLFVGKFIGESTVLKGKAESAGEGTCVTVGGAKIRADGRIASDRAAILVRPEKISLSRDQNSGDSNINTLPGVVSEKIYMGSSAKYEVALSDGTSVISRAVLVDDDFRLGDQVFVNWKVQDSKLLVDDEDINAPNT